MLDAARDEVAAAVEDVRGASAALVRALDILGDGGKGAYGRALGALTPELRDWWREALNGPADADSLAEWLDGAAVHGLCQRVLALRSRHEACDDRAVGDAFPPHRLEQLARLETHLDRKLERNLAILFRLRQLRRSQGAAP